MSSTNTPNNVLLPFQKSGVDFLLAPGKPHRLLADEQGLGKTVQVCAAIAKAHLLTGLIICPLAVKNQWKEHLLDWVPHLSDESIFIYRKTNERPVSLLRGNLPLVQIIHYEMLLNDALLDTLLKQNYDYVVCDEAQRLKSVNSARAKIVLGRKGPLIARGRHKWLLSGTIMPNRPVELYPMLRTLAPEVIEPHLSWEQFGRYFCSGFVENFGGFNFQGASHQEELAVKMSKFMLRREVDDVYEQLPPVIEQIYPIEVDIGDADMSNTPMPTLREIVGMAKAETVSDFVEQLLDDDKNHDEKVIVFAYSRSVIDFITERLRRFGAFKIYGGTKEADRERSYDAFMHNDSCRTLVLQIDACGEAKDGLQLSCSIAVFAEEDWVPGKFKQAISRLHRIKQTRPVRMIRLPAIGTLDDNQIRSRRKKTNWISQIIRKTDTPTGVIQMSVEDNLKEINETHKQINLLLQKAALTFEKMAVIMDKMATGCATTVVSAPQVENTKPQDKPDAKPDKPASKKPGNGKDKPNATTVAEQTTSSQPTSTPAPTVQTNPPNTKDGVGDAGLAALRRLTAAYKEQGNPDPQEAARLQISAALVSSTSNQAERIKDIIPVDYESAYNALTGLKAESNEADIESLI